MSLSLQPLHEPASVAAVWPKPTESAASAKPIAPPSAPTTGHSKVAKNVLSSIVTQLLIWLVTTAVNFALPRYLGATGIGQLQIATSFVLIFSMVAGLGTTQVLAKEIARDRAKMGRWLVAALTLRFSLGILCIPFAYGVARLLGYDSNKCWIILAAMPGMLGFIANEAFASAYQGLEEIGQVNRATLFDKILYSAVVMTLIYLKKPLWMIALAGGLSTGGAFLFYLWRARPHWPTMRLPSLALLKRLAVTGLPFLGVMAFRTLYGQTDPIVIGAVATAREAGWYAAAFRLVGSALFLPVAVTFALLPTLSRFFGENNKVGFKELAGKSMEIVMFLGVPLGAVLLLLPGPLVTLVFGPDFAPASLVLAIGGVVLLLYFATIVLGTLLMALDRQLVLTRSAFLSCLVGIPTCVLFSWLGGRFFGNAAAGAIVSDVLIEVYLLAVYVKALPRGLFQAQTWSRVVRYFLASLPMVVGLHLALGTPLGLWAALPCALVYLAACLLLRCWTRDDLSVLRTMLKRS